MVNIRGRVLSAALALSLGWAAAAPPVGTAVADDRPRSSRAGPDAASVMPVSDLLARVRQDFGGEAIKVELERDGDDGAGVWVYEAKILTPDGRVLKAVYRARDLALVSWKGRRERRLRSDDD